MTALDNLRETVISAMAARGNQSPYYSAIDGLVLLRTTSVRHPSLAVFQPSLCVVVQGAKWTAFGTHRHDYHTGQAMVAGLALPGASQIVEGSASQPYLSVVVGLDLSLLRRLYESMPAAPVPKADQSATGFVVDLDEPVLSCVERLVRMLREPAAIPLLVPGLMQELHYRLLAGEHGGRFVELAIGNERNQRMNGVLHRLRDRFQSPVSVAELAAMAGLSPTAFHRQFKATTGMSPMQFLKQMRLVEARRLLLSDEVSAETAAFRVGYASPSQFSREYARFFGAPPRRDIGRLLAQADRAA